MKSVMSRTGLAVAAGAALMSGISGVFVPYGYPWPTIAWAILACGLAVWVSLGSSPLTPHMSDVIGDVEAESPRGRAASRRRAAPEGPVS